jgi:hypothetical protein
LLVLHKASVEFQLVEEDDGTFKVTAGLDAPEFDTANGKLSAAALLAATAYASFVDGSLIARAEKDFGLDMGAHSMEVVT